MVLSAWDRAHTTADQNGDGVVNGVDLSYLLTHWGACGD